ncbi:F-box/WD-40 repeat-containing protein [Canna indica]|uniref:F-box/WD-40 repeat-containing protein n=1 Tax=Canna indica TaxID=4628 RepID=A0AAQ3L149_9LILI|nr:F-box/WD-40 repeat-containing protein [Canna indica]
MALECPEVEESSLKKFVDGSRCEEVPLARVTSPVLCSAAKPQCSKSSISGSILLEPISCLPLKKGDSKSGTTTTVGSGPNAHPRSFTELPAALVYEILQRLDAKELGVLSCVSPLLNSLISDHHGWKDSYFQRWGSPLGLQAPAGPGLQNQKSWKELFVEREFRCKSFMGRFSIDTLHGHSQAVRAVFLLLPAKRIFTGGYDQIIRMWDMEEGLSIAVSRPLGCTIRAITADSEILVAGGTSAFLHCWKAIDGHPHLFDIVGSSANHNSRFRLCGHEGPVTCLALDSTRIYSGSWDMCIRIWDRVHLKCLRTLNHEDWVWSLAPRGGTIASTAGRDAYVWDIDSGTLINVIRNAHVGNAYSLTRNHQGDILFTGGEDGSIHMYELCDNFHVGHMKPTATWIPHTGAVHSLAFEFPWVVSSSSDGRIALIDVRKLLKSGHSALMQHSKVKYSIRNVVEPPQRMLHGFGCNLFSIAIGANRIVCGGEEGVVRIWNFSQALEIEKRVQALRGVRLENRMRRRKAQIQMSGNGSRSDQCLSASRKNQLNGDCSGVWREKRSNSGKLKG